MLRARPACESWGIEGRDGTAVPLMLSDVEVVEAFFEAIYRLDFDAAVEFFTEDASYHDLPVPTDPAVGKEAIRRKLDFMIAGGVTSMDYEIRQHPRRRRHRARRAYRDVASSLRRDADAARHVHDRARRRQDRRLDASTGTARSS